MTGLVFSLFLIATLFLIGQYALMSIVMTTWWAKGKYLNEQSKKEKTKKRWRGGMKFRWDEYEDKDNGQYIHFNVSDGDVRCLHCRRWYFRFSVGSKISRLSYHAGRKTGYE